MTPDELAPIVRAVEKLLGHEDAALRLHALELLKELDRVIVRGSR